MTRHRCTVNLSLSPATVERLAEIAKDEQVAKSHIVDRLVAAEYASRRAGRMEREMSYTTIRDVMDDYRDMARASGIFDADQLTEDAVRDICHEHAGRYEDLDRDELMVDLLDPNRYLDES